jgi:hypothetical protein
MVAEIQAVRNALLVLENISTVARVGIITFNSKIQFYSIRENVNEPIGNVILYDLIN